ncbi:MAG: sel1 repeat family protein [Candidatus Melainabacteria bacterium]|nr:MAG: sel1 repeat family protein [Candidatus Melainabacteria bacterium]
MNSPIPPKHIAAIIIVIVTGVFAICATRYFEHINSELQHAEAAITEKKYRDARKILEPLAKNRNPKAARMLGELYDFGHGVAQNFYTSRKFYEIAMTGGDADGMSHLASLIGQGLGGYDDEKIAEQLSIKAAWLGSVEAKYVQGLMNLWGYRTKPNYESAFKFFHDAAEKQHGPSELLLAHMYAHGLGVKRMKSKLLI